MMETNDKAVFSKTIVVANKDRSTLTVYPSLVKDILNVETEVSGDFHIVNLLGEQVKQGQISPRIDVSGLPNGIYIFKLGITQTKFVKY